jgi:Ala-tRNA(Pro) deacylase
MEKISSPLRTRILDYLDSHHITYTLMTQKERAKLSRNIGAKSVLFKDKNDFRLFTIRADLSIDNKKVRKILGSHKLRFATLDEFQTLTESIPGTLTPISRGLYKKDFDHYIDESLQEQKWIVFNAGELNSPIQVRADEFFKSLHFKWCIFSKDN